MVRFFMPNVFGLRSSAFGALISLAVGFGITKLVWDLRHCRP
jgi:hypothetical protein